MGGIGATTQGGGWCSRGRGLEEREIVMLAGRGRHIYTRDSGHAMQEED